MSRIQSSRIFAGVLLVLFLSFTTMAPTVAAGTGATSTWSQSTTPSHEDLVILPGSDVIDFVVAGSYGDTLYAIGLCYDPCLKPGDYQYWADGENIQNEQLAPRLWKSSDHGVTWKDLTQRAQGASGIPAGEQFVFFSAVAAAPDDADFVVIAGYDGNRNAMIIGSADGGSSFSVAGCGFISGEVLCLAVSPAYSDIRQVAAGTKDLVNGARVWRLEVGSLFHGHWVDTSKYDGWLGLPWLTSDSDIFAVTSLAFSPAYDCDQTIVGVAIGLGFDPDLATSSALPDPLGYGPGFYPAFHYFAGDWNNSNAWNLAADFAAFPGAFRAGPLLLYASTYFTAGWTDFFESPFLRMATDIALPYDFTGAYATDMVALISVNGSLVPPALGLPAMEGGFVFLMSSAYPAYELIRQEDNPFVASVAYHGSVKMLGNAIVGMAFPEGWNSTDIRNWYETGQPSLPCCSGVIVLYTDTPIGRDPCCPDNWGRAEKPPTGQFNAQVAFNRDGSKAYASTQGGSFRANTDQNCWRGDESAFSVSLDRGSCWNQSGLIDTDIDFIADVAIGGNCDDVLIATINRPETGECCDCDSVWHSTNGGRHWLRIWAGCLIGDYDAGAEWAAFSVPDADDGSIITIYMADLGSDLLYRATAAGMCHWDCLHTVVDNIVDVASLDHSVVYVLDNDGRVGKSLNGGRRWNEAVDSESTDNHGEKAHRLAVQGDWILVGGDKGTIAYSKDSGASFNELDDIGDGQVHVAFDPDFGVNGYVYAAIAGGAQKGVYRTQVSKAKFESMDACPGLDYHGIVVSDSGTLYASYSGSATSPEGCKNSGVARLLDPTTEGCCSALDWDYLFDGLWADAAFTAQPNDVVACDSLSSGNLIVWAIDVQPGDGDSYYGGWNHCHNEFVNSNAGRLWQFVDVFANEGPNLIGVTRGDTVPSDDCECVNTPVVLEWDRLCDACEYDIEIALDSAFQHKVWTTSTISWPGVQLNGHVACDGVIECKDAPRFYYKPSDPCAPSIVVPKGALDCNTEYYWHVRARFAETGESYRSPWSEVWSFLVATGPDGAIRLTAPYYGAANVPRQNLVFTWTAISEATAYDLTIWDSQGVEVAINSTSTTSFVLDRELGYDAAFTWQVKAMKGANVLSTSPVSTFRTMVQPTPPPTFSEMVINFPEPAGTLPWVWLVIALAAALIIVVVVLIFRTRRM